MSPTHNTKTLGAYLRAARVKTGLSTRQVARQIGINHSYLVKLETDQNDHPSAEILQRLADLLRLDAGKLLRFVGVKPSSTLPAPSVYFRRKLGVNASEAKILARLIEDYQHRKEESPHDNEERSS